MKGINPLKRKSMEKPYFFPSQKLTEEEQELKDKGYHYLGWQVHNGNSAEMKHHSSLEHKSYKKSYSDRGSHDLHWCDDCEIFWDIDSSD